MTVKFRTYSWSARQPGIRADHHSRFPLTGRSGAGGQNLYLPTGASGDPQEGVPGLDGLGSIRQSMLESKR